MTTIGEAFPWAGGVLLALAAGFAVHTWSVARDLVRTQAIVTENVETFARGGGILYTPRLRFSTADGTIVLVLSRRGSGDIEFPAGKAVPVMYPRRDPRDAVIATIWRVYSDAIWLVIAGTVVFDVGWIARRMRSSPGAFPSG